MTDGETAADGGAADGETAERRPSEHTTLFQRWNLGWFYVATSHNQNTTLFQR